MAETQSTATTTTTEATAPTGDIKVFIDAFNKDFDVEIKKLVDAQQNYKNVYADAIKIPTPKKGLWPHDTNVVTIGDLFKYTFPDINSDKVVKPKGGTDYRGWLDDLSDSSDEKISKMYQTISNGIDSNSELLNFQQLKKPGITNPSLWSPGQYYFDVFMSIILSPTGPLKDPTSNNGGDNAFHTNSANRNRLKNFGGSASVSLFDPSGEIEVSKHISDTDVGFDYYEFSELLSSDSAYGIKWKMINNTGVSIGMEDSTSKPISYPSLKVQYKSGLLSELKNDTKFNPARGDSSDASGKSVEWGLKSEIDVTGYTFTGNYENILLYKAFVQAGDNYKSVVLPLRNPEPPTTTPDANPPLVKVQPPQEVGYTFNVEKKDSFVIVGGSMSGMEFTIVPNDGTTYIVNEAPINNLDDEEMLSDEYSEGEYQGNEESLFSFSDPSSYGTVDVASLNSIKGFDPEHPNESLSTDSTNKYPVSKDKDANIKAIIKAAKSLGVTNKFTITAILAIVSKETGFIPRSEASYATTSGARIISIFGSHGYSADQWDSIKKDPVKFFDIIYGGKYGNATNEGYKYRGRGFNQITFKGNYKAYASDTGIDIVNDPDLLNTVDVAAKCVVAYFKKNIKSAPNSIKSQYNFTDINSFTNLNDATGAIYHANAGWKHSYSEIVADSTGGRKKAFANAGPLYNTYGSQLA